MNIFVIGGGGREYAIIKKLKENHNIKNIYCAPGNGGIEQLANCINISPIDFKKQLEYIKDKNIDYIIVAPDDPLALGAVDFFEKEGYLCFGPRQNAARIESSKSFAKDLMKKYNIPTAKYETFISYDEGINYIDNNEGPYVLKADGLALGKGVLITKDKDEAKDILKSMLIENKFGDAGKKVVIEEFLEGPEVSVLCFSDGNIIKPMLSSMDHKRIGDNDTGLNTGGMGVIAPNPFYTKQLEEETMNSIILKTIDALNKEGCPFKGCLYFGLMLTKNGPKVIEYNCRFGDPETQAVLELMESDLLDTMIACTKGNLKDIDLKFSDDYCCFVVASSKGYPEAYEKGFLINIDDEIKDYTIIAGASLKDNKLYTNGGRVLGVLGRGKTLEEAINIAYERMKKINFEGIYYRKDIGQKGLNKDGL